MKVSPPSSRPSLAALAASTAKFRTHNDNLAAKVGKSLWPKGDYNPQRPPTVTITAKTLTAAELAPTLRQANDARAARLTADDLALYLDEFRRIVAYIDECVAARTVRQEDVDLLHMSLTEYRNACEAEPGTARRRALQAMREAVDRIDPTRR